MNEFSLMDVILILKTKHQVRVKRTLFSIHLTFNEKNITVVFCSFYCDLRRSRVKTK